jgi:hypothetical protein
MGQPKRKSNAKKRVGRPSDYAPSIALTICDQIANGTSLREICSKPSMPEKSKVMRWLSQFPEFQDQYARAREAQADYWAEEIIDISDDGSNDYMEKERPDGSTYEVVNQEHIQRSRLRVDTRKWLMARMAPKKYSERLQTDNNINVLISLADLVNSSYRPDLPALAPPKDETE